MKKLPIFLLMCAGCVTHEPLRGIPVEEAKNHIKEYITVHGKVFSTHLAMNGNAFINLGAAYPDQLLTVTEPHAQKDYPKIQSLKGKTISLTGVIKTFHKQPQIDISSVKQITQVSE